jgi:hypothetical protein
MSAKIEIDELQNLLIQAGVDQKTRSLILKEAKELAEEKKIEKSEEKLPKSKNEFVVVVRGNEDLEKVLKQCWVLSVPEGTNDSTVLDRLTKAAKEQNNKAKRQKTYLSTWGDLFTFGKREFSKEQNFAVKTKNPVPVYVLKTEKV